MSLVLILSDTHLSDRPPSACTRTYLEDLFTLLECASDIARERDVSTVIQAGDLFHIKSPAGNSHKLVLATINAFSKFPCPVFVVPGNHDLANDRFESIFETQPLGVVIESESAYLLSGWADAPSWLGKPLFRLTAPPIPAAVYGIPWLQTWNNSDESVRDQGVREALTDFHSRYDGSVPALIVTHAPFFPPSTESPFENYPTERFAKAIGDLPVSVYYGHIHEAHGIYTSGGIKFANAGALSRGSLHEYNLTREISVTLWDSETGEFEIIPIPHRPASEVFRLQEAQTAKTAQVELDSFLSSVGAATIEITSTESVLNHVRGLGLPTDVLKAIEDLLEKVA